MIKDYETTKAKILITYREINDLDVALALHGIENPDDIQQLSEDDNFIAQYKLIHAQFLRELLGNVKQQAKGQGQLALSATKLLLQTYHPAKFNAQINSRNANEGAQPIPPDREFLPVEAGEDSHDPEMKEILEEALSEDNDPHDITNKHDNGSVDPADPDASLNNGDGSKNEETTRLAKLKAELDARNKPKEEEYFDVVLPKHKRSALTRLNK